MLLAMSNSGRHSRPARILIFLAAGVLTGLGVAKSLKGRSRSQFEEMATNFTSSKPVTVVRERVIDLRNRIGSDGAPTVTFQERNVAGPSGNGAGSHGDQGADKGGQVDDPNASKARPKGASGDVADADTNAKPKKGPDRKARKNTQSEGQHEPAKNRAKGQASEEPVGEDPAEKIVSSDSEPHRWVRPDNGQCPESYPIKGRFSTGRYHEPDTESYEKIVPDCCFATKEDAEADGFRASQR